MLTVTPIVVTSTAETTVFTAAGPISRVFVRWTVGDFILLSYYRSGSPVSGEQAMFGSRTIAGGTDYRNPDTTIELYPMLTADEIRVIVPSGVAGFSIFTVS